MNTPRPDFVEASQGDDTPTKDSGNRVILLVLIGVLVLVGLPAMAVGAVLLARSNSSVDVVAPVSEAPRGPSTTAADGVGPTQSPSTDGSTNTSKPSVDEPLADMSGADTSPQETPFPLQNASYLKEVRVASHSGFDRVVFEFDGPVPGYRIAYSDGPLTEDPSDKPVELPGTPMQLTFSPASGVRINASDYTVLYTGPKRIDGTGRAIRELRETGDFEAVLSWGMGVAGKRPFKVSALDSPSRIVVDVKAE